MTVRLDDLADLIRQRRTSMVVDHDRVIAPGMIEQLCELATWAPNHKRTWPWRFASFTGDARHRLGEAFADDMIDHDLGDPGKHAKTRGKYARTPNVLVVGCAAHEHPTFHAENRDAVAAAIQNLLLAATAAGLASFWSTPPMIDSPRVLELCDFEPTDRIIAVIYLGVATTTVAGPQRPTANVRHLD